MKLGSVLQVHEKAWQEKFETNTLPANNNRATIKSIELYLQGLALVLINIIEFILYIE